MRTIHVVYVNMHAYSWHHNILLFKCTYFQLEILSNVHLSCHILIDFQGSMCANNGRGGPVDVRVDNLDSSAPIRTLKQSLYTMFSTVVRVSVVVLIYVQRRRVTEKRNMKIITVLIGFLRAGANPSNVTSIAFYILFLCSYVCVLCNIHWFINTIII